MQPPERQERLARALASRDWKAADLLMSAIQRDAGLLRLGPCLVDSRRFFLELLAHAPDGCIELVRKRLGDVFPTTAQGRMEEGRFEEAAEIWMSLCLFPSTLREVYYARGALAASLAGRLDLLATTPVPPGWIWAGRECVPLTEWKRRMLARANPDVAVAPEILRPRYLENGRSSIDLPTERTPIPLFELSDAACALIDVYAVRWGDRGLWGVSDGTVGLVEIETQRQVWIGPLDLAPIPERIRQAMRRALNAPVPDRRRNWEALLKEADLTRLRLTDSSRDPRRFSERLVLALLPYHAVWLHENGRAESWALPAHVLQSRLAPEELPISAWTLDRLRRALTRNPR